MFKKLTSKYTLILSFEVAHMLAQSVVRVCERILEEPGHNKVHRWSAAKTFEAAEMPEVPSAARRQLTPAEKDLRLTILFKALCREGKAGIGLCNQAIRDSGSGEMSDEQAEKIRSTHNSASACKFEAHIASLPSRKLTVIRPQQAITWPTCSRAYPEPLLRR